MKIFVAVFLLIIVCPVYAGCNYVTDLNCDGNSCLQISDGDCLQDKLIINTWKYKKKLNDSGQKIDEPIKGGDHIYDFLQECKFTNKIILEERGFSCLSSGHTILAGRTYEPYVCGKERIEDSGNFEPILCFKCTKGCSKNSIFKILTTVGDQG